MNAWTMNKAVHDRIIQAMDRERAKIARAAAEDVAGRMTVTEDELQKAFAMFDNQVLEIQQNWA